MRRLFLITLLCSAVAVAYAQSDSASVAVTGSLHVGVSTSLNSDQDKVNLSYTTNDPRLGTNSGCHYLSDVNDVSQNVQATYGAQLNLALHPQHTLALSFEGANDCEHAMGSRSESLWDKEGNLLSRVHGQYDHPNERANELSAALDYTYRTRRPGSALTLGYRYRWQNEQAGVEQQAYDAQGWSLFRENVLEQQINYHYHHAYLDYALPVAKGHLLDFGVAYDRRELLVQTEQDWDELRVLSAEYRHLMQYGGVHARYRLRLGPVEAMAHLEYRATRMQNRWLHDVLPTATVRYRVDSVHSLSAFYTIMLIRPEVQHLDTTRITDAYTTRFGKDEIVGVHVHNVALTYRAQLPRVEASAELRYLTATDGFNAIWMERGGNRIYTWGNEGVRHAIGLTPAVNSHLTPTTDFHWAATLMWDERVAEAINLRNANWGIRTDMRLTQRLFASASDTFQTYVALRGDYAYHNTLDVYSYAGHGGSVGADLDVSLKRSLRLGIGYTCRFKPDIHITQGAYVGTLEYLPGASHLASLHLSYHF